MFLRVLEATFEKIARGYRKQRWRRGGMFSEKWTLHVYPVPSGAKSRVREGLLKKGLPGIRAWLVARREHVWLYGRHSSVASSCDF